VTHAGGEIEEAGRGGVDEEYRSRDRQLKTPLKIAVAAGGTNSRHFALQFSGLFLLRLILASPS